MSLFYRIKTINADLKELSLVELLNFSRKNIFDLGGTYLNKVFHPNHIQLAIIRDRVYSSGVHDFEYFEEIKQIKIYSRYRRSAFRVYISSISPLLILIFNEISIELVLQLIGIGVLAAIFFSLILIIGIKSESKEMERKLLIRLNLLNQRGYKRVIL